MIIDKHVHSPYCPHGSKDTIEAYILQAIKLHYREISFTEHAPLPKSFVDPTPNKDSAMSWDDLPRYMDDVQKLQEKYRRNLTINLGLEVDYIEGYEEETTSFLNEYGPILDDSILSVHFLKREEAYYCLDYSDKNFQNIIQVFGGLEEVYDAYFQTVKHSILANLGEYKPTRIGHITLVNKFKRKFPANFDKHSIVLHLLDLVKSKGYSLDYNGAGIVKPDCGETYPTSNIALEAAKRKIPLIYGSDAHSAKDLKQGFDYILKELL